MDIKYEVMDFKNVTIIGKEGMGPAGLGGQWVPQLWKEFTENVSEVAALALHDEQGKPKLWGAMLDSQRRFLPWEDEGLYIAGIEVDAETEAPYGWAKWTLPSFRCAAVSCAPKDISLVMQRMILHELPDHGFDLCGAVQEYYDHTDEVNGMKLLFPIELI